MKLTLGSARMALIRGLAFAATVLFSNLVSAQGIDFDKDVAPIFAAKCVQCHGRVEPKGGLSLLTSKHASQGGESGKVIVARDSAMSLLWERISQDEMPPKHPLSPKQKSVIKRWIDQGAKWGTSPIDPFAFTTDSRAGRDWWALQPLKSIAVPEDSHEARNRKWANNEIDWFILDKLRNAGLSPGPQADSRTLVRRLYFDLIGLPPSPEAVQAFAKNPSSEAYAALVERLLASKHYGERWGRHWLDVVRFGESDGFERNNPRRNAWHYRDWVVNAFNNDLPYNEFVRRQLIGDLTVGGPEGASATGFWVAGVHNTVVGGSRRMKLLARQDEIEEVLATVGQTFLGLTINCARCHDHKFDPITQREFYQMASAISGLGYGERNEKLPADAARAKTLDDRLSAFNSDLRAIDKKARDGVIAARKKGTFENPKPPRPFASWEFDADLRDSIGDLHGKIVGGARLENGALVVGENGGYVETAPLKKNITEKTLEVWVQLADLKQAGGGAITIETRNGVIFDSIVYAEREPQQWMAGSNGFVRSASFNAPQESDASKNAVHIAIVYQRDGTIIGYRNGVPYGRVARKSGLQTYQAGQSEIIFGLRHKPVGGNRHLRARILKAAFHDRALKADEVAAIAGSSIDFVSEEQIVKWLSPEKRTERQKLKDQIAATTHERALIEAKANPRIYTLTPKGGERINVLLRGDPDAVGELVSPGGVRAVAGVNSDFGLAPEAPEAERRKKLAEWITDKNNSLFARVMVNRIWHYHFGTGLVDTPNDFGFNGGRPSHQELLDWLAAYFINSKYSVKAVHRLIVNSRTWQQAGYIPPGGRSEKKNPADIDADNRLLWRMTPRRLEAESVRDAMLVVAGKLNRQLGGPSFEDVTVTANNGTTYYEPKQVEGPAYDRRTIYRFNPRGGRSALLDTFDCPDPAATAPRRAVTTTPLQALSLLNNSFVLRMSQAFAERVQTEAGANLDAQIKHAWRLAVAREPNETEHALSRKLVDRHGLPALCRGMFNLNEFVVVE